MALLTSFVGNYHTLATRMMQSIADLFCVNEPLVQYRVFVFTDNEASASWARPFVTTVPIEKRGWPHDSMLRPRYYLEQRHLWQDYDFVFSLDADLQLYDHVCLDILAPRVGVLVPWQYRVRAPLRVCGLSGAYCG